MALSSGTENGLLQLLIDAARIEVLPASLLDDYLSAPMHIRRCPDPLCHRPFQVNRFSVTVATLTAPGKIICPHCGLTMEGEDDSVFLTHALSLEQEAEFNAQHPHC